MASWSEKQDTQWGIANSELRFAMHDDISCVQSVILGLTQNPVFSWIPAGVYPDENRGRNDALRCD